MTDLPVIMSAPMVLATLREIEAPGTGKIMTRRLAWDEEPCPQSVCPFAPKRNHAYPSKTCESCPRHHGGGAGKPSRWQKAKTGDRLYVREALVPSSCGFDYDAGDNGDCIDLSDLSAKQIEFWNKRTGDDPDNSRKVSPRHMPRWASRITLIVTAVRVERLNVISEADASAEGWQKQPARSSDPEVHSDAARDWFSDLWNSLHGAGAWEANPEVVAITFKPVLANIDALEALAA